MDIQFIYGFASGMTFCIVLLFFWMPTIRKQSDKLDEIIKRLKSKDV